MSLKTYNIDVLMELIDIFKCFTKFLWVCCVKQKPKTHSKIFKIVYLLVILINQRLCTGVQISIMCPKLLTLVPKIQYHEHPVSTSKKETGKCASRFLLSVFEISIVFELIHTFEGVLEFVLLVFGWHIWIKYIIIIK